MNVKYVDLYYINFCFIYALRFLFRRFFSTFIKPNSVLDIFGDNPLENYNMVLLVTLISSYRIMFFLIFELLFIYFVNYIDTTED